jgi:hypothetical protein
MYGVMVTSCGGREHLSNVPRARIRNPNVRIFTRATLPSKISLDAQYIDSLRVQVKFHVRYIELERHLSLICPIWRTTSSIREMQETEPLERPATMGMRLWNDNR